VPGAAGREKVANRDGSCPGLVRTLVGGQVQATSQPDKVRRWRPPEYTEEEWPYRQVISYVRVELATHRGAPTQAQEWASRLEAELREHLRHDGARPPAPGP